MGPIKPTRPPSVAHGAPPNTGGESLFCAKPQACAGPCLLRSIVCKSLFTLVSRSVMLGGLSLIAKFPLLSQARIVTSWTGRGTSFCLLRWTRARDKKTLYCTPCFNAVLEATERSLTVELPSFSAQYSNGVDARCAVRPLTELAESEMARRRRVAGESQSVSSHMSPKSSTARDGFVPGLLATKHNRILAPRLSGFVFSFLSSEVACETETCSWYTPAPRPPWIVTSGAKRKTRFARPKLLTNEAVDAAHACGGDALEFFCTMMRWCPFLDAS